jgi:putative ABC transport system permease protein
MWQDLRFSVRLARRSPLLTVAVVATLALGVGLDAGIFTIIDGAVRRPRVERDPDSFVHIQADFDTPTLHFKGNPFGTTASDYAAYRAGTESLSELAAWHIVRVVVAQDPTPTLAMRVSCNFFAVYGVTHALLGRSPSPTDCDGSQNFVVLSEELWRTRFEADSQIVGKTIELNGDRVPVIGIVPADFAGQLRGPGYWMPLLMQAADTPRLALEGRLRRGFSRAAAERELTALARQQDRAHVGRHTSISVTNGSVLEDPLLRRAAAIIVLLTMSGLTLVLAIACANVIGLLLSRAVARQREMAIRASLGASRSRLAAMLITEGLLLAFAALPFGAYLSYQVPRIAKVMVPMLPYYNMRPNLAVFAYLVAITAITGCLAGLAPAAESLRADLSSGVRGRDAVALAGTRWRIRDLLIAGQVAMSLVLLVGAVLFTRAESAIRHSDAGLDTEHTLVMPVRGVSPAARNILIDRVGAIPGVRSVAAAQASPFDVELMPAALVHRADQADSIAPRSATVSAVAPEYFETLRMPALRGHVLSRGGAAHDVVVSQSLARALGLTDSIGVQLVDDGGRTLVVVGVVRDVNLPSGSPAMIYRRRADDEPGGVLLAHVAGSTPGIGQHMRQALTAIEPSAAVQVRTLAAAFEDLAAKFSVLVTFVGFLGIVGVLLALIGVYGVVAFAVSRRTKEVSIRIALGATRPVIMRLLLSGGVAPVAVGLAAGLLLSLVGASVLGKVLAGTPVPIDVRNPSAFALAAAMLVTTALAAMSVPAWRATMSDPVEALPQD